MGRLTTHVLDTYAGRPAEGLDLSLWRCDADGRTLLREARTNADGRCDAPLLEGERLQRGRYLLRFLAGAYFQRQGLSLPEPPFLDEIDIRFGVADSAGRYHVPLLLTPWSYATYRGS